MIASFRQALAPSRPPSARWRALPQRIFDTVALRPAVLFRSFQSFGDNCEFGFVQDAHKAHAIGLFKFASTSAEALIGLLDTRFQALASPTAVAMTVELRKASPDSVAEYIVILEGCGIKFHAGKREDDSTPDLVRSAQAKRVALLSRKMMEELEGGEKIFVFKSEETAPRATIDALVRSMRAYGPTTLLWVTPPWDGHHPGYVERAGEGLLRGAIDHFSPYDDAGRFGSAYWPRICHNAYRLWAPVAGAGASR